MDTTQEVDLNDLNTLMAEAGLLNLTDGERVVEDVPEVLAAEADGSEEASEEQIARALANISLDEIREKTYTEQVADAGIQVAAENPVQSTDTVPETPAPTAARKKRAKKVAGTGTGKRVGRAAAAGSLAAYAQSLFPIDTSIEPVVAALPKKCQEKAAGYFAHRAGKGKLSVFMQQALKAVHDMPSVTAAELVVLYQGSGYSLGTARSQAQQMMTVLPAIGLATRSGATLTQTATADFWATFSP